MDNEIGEAKRDWHRYRELTKDSAEDLISEGLSQDYPGLWFKAYQSFDIFKSMYASKRERKDLLKETESSHMLNKKVFDQASEDLISTFESAIEQKDSLLPPTPWDEYIRKKENDEPGF